MTGPVLAVGAIAVRDECLLLVRRGRVPAQGRWAPPGGRVEPGELLVETVTRELAEETGLTGVCGPLIGVAERFDGDEHFVILDYAVTVIDDAEAVAGNDAAEVAWVPLPDVTDWPLVDGLAEFLHDHAIIETYC